MEQKDEKVTPETQPKKCRLFCWMKRIVLWILGLILAFLLLILSGGTHALVKYVACPIANKIGVPVSVETFAFYPLTGYLHITNLKVENPKSFTEGSNYYVETPLLELGNFEFDFDVSSLFSDEYTVDTIQLTGLHALYALDYNTSNVDALIAQITGDKPSDDAIEEAPERVEEIKEERKEAQEEAKEKKELRFLIRHINLADNHVRFYNGSLGLPILIPLPPLEMRDVDNRTVYERLRPMTDLVIGGYETLVNGLGRAADVLKDGAAAANAVLSDSASAAEAVFSDSASAAGDVISDGAAAVEEAAGAAVEGVIDIFNRKK